MSGDIHEADAAIVPANLAASGPDSYESDEGASAAVPLRVNAAPQDHTLTPGDQDWYELWGADGAGYVRIGSTGGLRIAYVLAPTDQPDWIAAVGGPPAGADLIENWTPADTEYASGLGVETVYMVVGSQSARPVSYRISFASQLPSQRTGSVSADSAAADYLRALMRGDLDELYMNSGVSLTDEQAGGLREALVGRREPFDGIVEVHGSPARAEDEDRDSPVQHLVVAEPRSLDDIDAWAFVVACEERDQLWVVTDVRRDPEVTDDEAVEQVRLEYEMMFGQGAAGTGGSSGGAPSEDGAGVRRPLAIGAAMGVAALTGVVAFFLLRRRGQRMAKPSAGPILVATFGSTTEWVGRTIVQEGGVFVLEGHGRVSAADVMSYDRDGHLVWPSEGSRAWVGSQAGAGSAPTAQSR